MCVLIAAESETQMLWHSQHVSTITHVHISKEFLAMISKLVLFVDKLYDFFNHLYSSRNGPACGATMAVVDRMGSIQPHL